LDSFRYLAYLTGRFTEAVEYYTQALRLCRDSASRTTRRTRWTASGTPMRPPGTEAGARDAWRRAQELYETQNRTEVRFFIHGPA
jgi:hypothetical protein